MIRIEATGNRLCDGLSRRELLRFGGLGAVGLWATGLTSSVPATAANKKQKVREV